jgi:hypothetical protein
MKTKTFAALLLSLVLAGCSGGDDASSAGEVAPDSLPAGPARWTVTESGIGPLRAGMTVAEAGFAVGAQLPSTAASPQCAMVRVPNSPGELWAMVVSDTVVRFDVRDPIIETAAGARVGDPEDRVGELYPGRVRVGPHKYTAGRYLVVPAEGDTTQRIVFETDSLGIVTTYRAGRYPEVEWVEGCG